MSDIGKSLKFIQSQKLMAIASHNTKEVWVANVYFSVDENGNIYFISSNDAKHSQMILKNSNVAFSIAWFDSTNSKNRKGIQGIGACKVAESLGEITVGVKLLYENFPDLRDILTVDWILSNAWSSRLWVLKPSYLKYWDDEVYGDDESEEIYLK